MVLIALSTLVDAQLIDGKARCRLASECLQAPELIDAEQLALHVRQDHDRAHGDAVIRCSHSMRSFDAVI